MLDAGTASAIAALVVAVLAMFVALAQAFQQYIASGAMLRLCDSVVYGGYNGLPGRATRVWSFRQFRFRVIYEVPIITIGLDRSQQASFEDPRVSYAYGYGERDAEEEAMTVLSGLKGFDGTYQVGEASWVSFCRRLRANAGAGVAFTTRIDDADRCPGDLPNVPIRLPLSEVVQMAALIGLECDVPAGSPLALSMSGSAGTITSSMHPILGLLLHFNPASLRTLEVQEVNVGFPGFHLSRIRGEVVFFDASARRNLCGTSPKPYVLEYGERELMDSSISDLEEFRKRLAEHDFEDVETVGGDQLGRRYAIDGKWSIRRHNYVTQPEDIKEFATLVVNPGNRDLRDPKGKQNWNEQFQGNSYPPNSPQVKNHITLNNTNHPWYWLCQMPILWGYWATPWKESVDIPSISIAFQSLARYIIELPLGNSPNSWACHAWVKQSWLAEWAIDAAPEPSWPPYSTPGSVGDFAHVGRVPAAEWEVLPHSSFDGAELPRLVYSSRYNPASLYLEWDETSVRYSVKRARMDVLQLTYLDGWLSFAGRCQVLRVGPTRVLQMCPVLVDYFIRAFLDEVADDWNVAGRAIQDDQQFLHMGATKGLHERMAELGMTEAEALFVMVAITRALGVAICIGTGVDTSAIQSLLHSRVQTFMV